MSQFPRWHKSLKTDFYSTYTTLYFFLLELQKEPNPTPFLHISWQDLGGEHLACCVRSKLPFSVCTVRFSSSLLPLNQRALLSQPIQQEFSPVTKKPLGVSSISIGKEQGPCLCFSNLGTFQPLPPLRKYKL